MKIVLFIYLGFVVGCILFIFLSGFCARAIYLRRYPDLGLPKRTFIERLLGSFRALIISAIPIFNIFMLFYFIFKNEDIIEKALKILKEKREKEMEE